ncbi:MAG TPA: DUF5671 domain-containing protein [Candidatus Paceibacterota bacterium]
MITVLLILVIALVVIISVISVGVSNKMENIDNMSQKPRTTPKDFFINLGAIVALYTVVVTLLNLLFTVINVAYPKVTSYYYYGSQSISLPVSTLIIFFPIFILLMWLLEKGYSSLPEKRNLPVRRWLTYITLFIAGLVLAGDLVTVIYYWIDGQELTAGFLLKALSVLVVIFVVFMYYITDIRGKLTSASRKVWLSVAVVIILGSIIWGFSVLGSPRTQRLIKYDTQKANDLQNIQYQIINYWQMKGKLPADLAALSDSISGYSAPTDPQTQKAYVYKVTGAKTFQLCADFNLATADNKAIVKQPIGYGGGDNWTHDKGEDCFDKTIDDQIYPVRETIMKY